MSSTRVLVHLVERYSFADKDTPGREVNVNTLHCLAAEPMLTDREQGCFGFKVAVSASVASGLQAVPGWYDPQWRDQPNRKTGKYERKCVGMVFIGPAEGFVG